MSLALRLTLFLPLFLPLALPLPYTAPIISRSSLLARGTRLPSQRDSRQSAIKPDS